MDLFPQPMVATTVVFPMQMHSSTVFDLYTPYIAHNVRLISLSGPPADRGGGHFILCPTDNGVA